MAFALALAAGCVTAPEHGPIPVRNQHPVQLTILDLDPTAATTLDQGDIGFRSALAYSSLFLADTAGSDAFVMDGEVLRASVSARVGLGAGFEAAIELPVLHTSGGFLDSFLIDYHDAFGLPDQDRSLVEKNRFEVVARHQGVEGYRLEEEPLMLADIPVTLAWSALRAETHGVGLLLRAGIEAPTGDPDRGAGNGAVDTAIGACASLPLEDLTLHAGIQHTFAGTPSSAREAGFGYEDVTSAGGTLEFGLTPRLSALVQTRWETSALRQLDATAARREHVLLWLGGRYLVGRDLFVELSLGEDLQGRASPDVTFWFSLAWLPGGSQTGSAPLAP